MRLGRKTTDIEKQDGRIARIGLQFLILSCVTSGDEQEPVSALMVQYVCATGIFLTTIKGEAS